MSYIIKFETALLAKEKGFPFDHSCGFDSEFYVTKRTRVKWGRKVAYEVGDLEKDMTDQTCCDYRDVKGQNRLYAPTQDELQEWLREEHKIYIAILPFNPEKDIFELHIYYKKNNEYKDSITTEVGSYIEVLENGLIEALNFI